MGVRADFEPLVLDPVTVTRDIVWMFRRYKATFDDDKVGRSYGEFCWMVMRIWEHYKVDVLLDEDVDFDGWLGPMDWIVNDIGRDLESAKAIYSGMYESATSMNWKYILGFFFCEPLRETIDDDKKSGTVLFHIVHISWVTCLFRQCE